MWHDEQDSLPSRTGMWANLSCLLTIVRWHCAHSPVASAALSCFSPAALWMLWQLVQPTLRWSCWLPAQNVCSVRKWQLTQVSLASRGDIAENRRIFVLSPPASACSLPGPWQPSQPIVALVSAWQAWQPFGDVGVPARNEWECAPVVSDAFVFSWQPRQVSLPAYAACGAPAWMAGALAVS